MARKPDPIDAAAGARIRRRRLAIGVTQAELARTVGTTFQQVQKYENGRNRVPTSRLVAIAAALDTSVSALVGEHRDVSQDTRLAAELATPGAIKLLAAFAGIEDARARAALLSVVQSMTNDNDKGTSS